MENVIAIHFGLYTKLLTELYVEKYVYEMKVFSGIPIQIMPITSVQFTPLQSRFFLSRGVGGTIDRFSVVSNTPLYTSTI